MDDELEEKAVKTHLAEINKLPSASKGKEQAKRTIGQSIKFHESKQHTDIVFIPVCSSEDSATVTQATPVTATTEESKQVQSVSADSGSTTHEPKKVQIDTSGSGAVDFTPTETKDKTPEEVQAFKAENKKQQKA